jgi:hypothetical protein
MRSNSLPSTHSVLGVDYEFKPNAQDHSVCEVSDPAAIAVFESFHPSFRVYEQQPDESISPVLFPSGAEITPVTEPTVEQVTDAPISYILKNGDIEFDLRPLSDDALRAFALANDIKVHHKAKGDTIRDAIVQALTTEG